MIKRRIDSKIEVWSENYINNRAIRTAEDRDLIIEQIEPCGGCAYIVEVYEEGTKMCSIPLQQWLKQEGEG